MVNTLEKYLQNADVFSSLQIMVSLSFISPIVEDDVLLFCISPKLFGVSFCSLCNVNLLIFMDVPCYLTNFVSDLLKLA